MFLMNVDGFLVNVDLSHNRLRTIDVTNIVWTKQKAFCEVNFSNNMISSQFTITDQFVVPKIEAITHQFSKV
jgi:hypothetical protein